MKKLNAVILTSCGGQGLLNGSAALKEAFIRVYGDSININTIDFFENGSPAGKILTKIYNLFLRKSILLNTVFVWLIHTLRADRNRMFFGKAIRNIESIIENNKPDFIVLTCQYIIDGVSHIFKKLGIKIPVYISNIDIGTSCIPLWFNADVRLHILPTEDTLEAYRKYGFPEDKAVVAGLLIREKFLPGRLKTKTELRKSFGTENLFSVLFTNSREGYEGMFPTIMKLKKYKGLNIVVICGRNRKFAQKLRNNTADFQSKVTVIEWCENIEDYMNAADVIIGKPGKQTVKESIACCTPLIVTAFPRVMQQEQSNVDYLKRRNVALTAESSDEVIEHINKLRENPELINELQSKLKNCLKEINPDKAAETILKDFSRN